jgi:hypothetical protein
MNDERNDLPVKLPEKIRPWASASVLVAVAALGWGVAQSVGSFFNSVRVQLSDSAVCCERFRQYQDEDSQQRHYWVGVIDRIHTNQSKIQSDIAELRADLRALQNDPHVRPDPFTGSEGRELERRIKRLEQQ